jgi:hypothetical protein
VPKMCPLLAHGPRLGKPKARLRIVVLFRPARTTVCATITGVANAHLTREANNERVALEVYFYAERIGRPVTRALSDRRLAELRSHPAGCLCASPCDLAQSVGPSQVYWIAVGWARGAAKARALARR